MSGVSRILTDEIVKRAQARLKQLGKDRYASAKLQAVVSAKEHGITKVAEVFNISRTTLFSWINIVKQDNLEELQISPGRGRKPILTEEQIETVRGWIEGNSQLTIDQVKARIFDELDTVISRSTTHRIIKSQSFSYITPRPKHYKQEVHEQEIFKKN